MTENSLVPVEVTAAVIVRDGKILLARRKGGDLDGLWEFPGGKMEPGESWAMAIEREIMEELALKISACNRLMIIEHDYPKKRVRLHFIQCKITGGEQTDAASPDLCESAWYDPLKIPAGLALCPPDRIALSRVNWKELFSNP